MAIFSILFIIGVSCSLPLQGGAGASISITVKGVVPKTARQNASRNDASSRLIFPALTVSIRVRAVLSDGTERSASTDYSSETLSLSLTGLPANQALDIYVESLSAAGIVITSWHESRVLSGGPNQITAVLAPIIEGGAITFGAFPSSTPTAPLARNGVRFDTFNGLAAGDEVHFIYDTGRAEFASVTAYDSSWNELPPVAGGGSEGWVVVAVPADGIVNTMTRNVLSSPGYPERTINGFMQAREAVFADSDPGDGTSASPIQFDKLLIRNGVSLFLRTGTYGSFSYTIENMDVQLYSGFSGSSWMVRNPEDSPSTLSGDTAVAAPTLSCGDMSSGRLDGMHISSSDIGSSTLYTGLAISSAGNWVAYNCSLSGFSGTTGATNFDSGGLRISQGTPEISNCYIDGGNMQTDPASGPGGSTTGIQITGASTNTHPYIHNCSIDGGRIVDGYTPDLESDEYSYGIHLDGDAAATISQCTIWGGHQYSNDDVCVTKGVFNEGSGGITVVSCVISGGDCDSGYQSNATGVDIAASDGSSLIGCTIDGGLANLMAAHINSISLSQTEPMKHVIADCILFDSITNDVDCFGIYQQYSTASVSRVSGNAFFNCIAGRLGASQQASLNDMVATNNGNNSGLAERSPDDELDTWANNVSTFGAFLASNWRPASTAIYAGSSSNEGPATWGVFTEEMLALYPGLTLDMAGRPRPSTWARGAYEP